MRLSTVCWSKSLYRKMHPRSRFPAFFLEHAVVERRFLGFVLQQRVSGWKFGEANADETNKTERSCEHGMKLINDNTLPETNSEFTPENWWLGDDPFLLGPGLFSAAFAVGLRDGSGDAQIFTDICKASGLGMKSLLKSRLHEHWWMFFGYEILPFFKDQLKI